MFLCLCRRQKTIDKEFKGTDCCCEQRLSTGRVTVVTTLVLSTLMAAATSAWRTAGTSPAVGGSWSCRYQGGEISLLSSRDNYSSDPQVQCHQARRILSTIITTVTITLTILQPGACDVLVVVFEEEQ